MSGGGSASLGPSRGRARRLELEDVLKSWSVPKRPPPESERSAAREGDRGSPARVRRLRGRHPQRTIRRRHSDLWDAETGPPLDANPHQAYRAGKLHIALSGKKLKSAFVLERRGRDDRAWVLVELPDACASSAVVVTRRRESVVTGRYDRGGRGRARSRSRGNRLKVSWLRGARRWRKRRTTLHRDVRRARSSVRRSSARHRRAGSGRP